MCTGAQSGHALVVTFNTGEHATLEDDIYSGSRGESCWNHFWVFFMVFK